MLSLITFSNCGEACAAALESSCGEQVERVVKLSVAATRLRQREYSAVIIDQNLADTAPDGALEALTSQLGTAAPVYVNFALTNADRLINQVRQALRRGQLERARAARAASLALRNQVNGTLTGILISSELALSVPGLPEAAMSKMRSVRELADGLRKQLEAAVHDPARR